MGNYHRVIINCMIINIVFLSLQVLQWTVNEYISVELLEKEYLLYVVYLLFSLKYRKMSICSIYGLFLVTYQFFLSSMVILNAVGMGPNFAETNFFTGFTFELEVQKYMIMLISISLIMIDIGLLLGIMIWGWSVPKWKYNLHLEKIAIGGMCATFILVLIGDYQYMQTIGTAGGYLALYVDKDIQKPFLSKMDAVFFLFSYMYMVSAPEKNFRKYFIIMYVTCCLGKALSGGRGEAITGLLILIWWINFYVNTISWKKFVVSGLCLSLFAMGIGTWRGNMNVKDFEVENFLSGDSTLLDFIVSNSSTIGVIGYTIYYEDEINNMGVQAIIYPFSNYWKKGINGEKSDIVTEIDESLGAYISYLSNSDFYFAGMGLGTVFIAELFAVGGLVGVIIGCFLLGMFIVLCVKVLQYNWLTWIILFKFFNALLLLPRTPYFSFFPEIPHLLRNILIMYFLYVVFKKISILPNKI